MRIYLTIPQPSRGLQRIADALTRYAPPSVEVVESIADADLVVLYAIGRCEQLTAQARELMAQGKKYAVIQVCLRSTQKPETWHWMDLWHGAEVVWSYYDLKQAILDDCTEEALKSVINDGTGFGGSRWRCNFYHAPLGADARVFYPRSYTFRRHGPTWLIATSGFSRLSESVRECWLAAENTFYGEGDDGARVFHFGGLKKGSAVVDFHLDLTDEQLAYGLSQCRYVSGLRRIEGFELPAVEGLLCGARPILFNSPDYRHWYEPWGVFIEETNRQGVIDQLVELFRGPYRAVTEEEIAAARERYDWGKIVGGFYGRIL